ncbi:MAG: DNA gyrase inhibitor GyrI [Granulosicoccus sp.]
MECNLLPERMRTSTRKLPTLLLIAATLILSTACSVFGVESVEEAPYQTVLKENEFEIRDYAPFVVAQTRIDASYKEAGNKAFRKLFAYISGENETRAKIAMTAPVIAEPKIVSSSEKIAMTAPVLSQQDGEAWLYKFVLPKGFTVDTAPRPLNPDVTIAETAPQRVATIRYSGRSTDKARVQNTKALKDWIESTGLVQQSEPRWAGYNAPWTLPPLRRNEVLIDVATP